MPVGRRAVTRCRSAASCAPSTQWTADQSHQLRDLRAADVARAAALQGDLGGGGADRFRNPDEVEVGGQIQRRAACYERLSLPTQVGNFIGSVRADLAEALRTLDDGMPYNSGVRLDPRRRHPTIVSPLDPQSEPPGLSAIKAELAADAAL